jgi:CRISPR type III-A-associated RAMP protein Csm4
MKKKFHVFRLSFPDGLHVNNGKGSYETAASILRSDMFYAALMSVFYEKKLDFPFPLDTISSLFPFATINNDIKYFLPKPYLPQQESVDSTQERKLIKSVQWIETGLFEKLAHGQLSFKTQQIANGFLFDSPQTDFTFDKRFMRTRIRKGLTNEMPELFDFEEVHLSNGCGFYFLVEALSETALNNLQLLLSYLAEQGIGSDRAVGKGRFIVNIGTMELSFPDDANALTNWALYIPKDKKELKELMADNALLSYSLIRRGGWLTHPGYPLLRKNEVYCFEEAGIFSGNSRGLCLLGKDVDLIPAELLKSFPKGKAIRNGKSLFVPLKVI